LTQKLYDELEKDDVAQVNKRPYQASTLIEKMTGVLPALLKEDRVTTHLLLDREKLATLVEEVGEIVTRENTLVQILQQAYSECEDYAARCRPKKSSDEGGKTKKSTKAK
jgi:hypothetical protein